MRFAAIVLAAFSFVALAARAEAPAPEAIAQAYLDAVAKDGEAGAAPFYEDLDLERYKTFWARALTKGEQEGASILAEGVSAAELVKLAPREFYAVMARQPINAFFDQMRPHGGKALGVVREGEELAHVVVRGGSSLLTAMGGAEVFVFTLHRHGDAWFVAMPLDYEKFGALMESAGKDDAAP